MSWLSTLESEGALRGEEEVPQRKLDIIPRQRKSRWWTAQNSRFLNCIWWPQTLTLFLPRKLLINSFQVAGEEWMDEQISGWMNEWINIYWSQDFKLLESKSLAHSSRSRWQAPGTRMADITKRCLFSFCWAQTGLRILPNATFQMKLIIILF